MVLPGQKPSMIRSLVNCNALIDMPPNHPPIEVGQEVSVLLLNTGSYLIQNFYDPNFNGINKFIISRIGK